jgi:transcriptional regulator GlxA family with amidase domain
MTGHQAPQRRRASAPPRKAPHRIAALCLDRVVAFDLATAAEAFDLAWRHSSPAYEFTACAVEPGSVATTTGFTVGDLAGLEAIERAETVIVPGYLDVFEPPPEPALEALRAAATRGARIVSICTGAFALAFAGVLDGRRATTHWFAAAALAEMFPRIDVDPDALYVDEGEVLTSAGLSAGIDLCLHLIRSDHGERVGARVARVMVAAPHRDGGQAQFIERALPASNGSGSLEGARAWALEHLTEQLDVATLAARASVSPRTFARRFVAETGTTPLKWLHNQRVLEARRLLEHTDLSVEQVAAQSGFGSAPSLREHFRRATATTPTAYRRTFAGAAA